MYTTQPPAPPKRNPLRLNRLLCAIALGGSAMTVHAAYDLVSLERLGRVASPALMASRAEVQSAESAVSAAAAFPNPELEYQRGNVKPRVLGASRGNADSIALTQALELPWVRSARIGAAEASLAATRAGDQLFEAEWLSRLRLRYYDVLRRDAELSNAQTDLQLTENLTTRIRHRVNSGEAPRFELIKAEAELLNAQKNVQAAAARVTHARLQLRQAVGPDLPEDFLLTGALTDIPEIEGNAQTIQQVDASNPWLQRAQSEVSRAEQQLRLEKAQRLPALALKATQTTEPDTRVTTGGFVISIPVWDRRTGKVGEAGAQLTKARHQLSDQTFALRQSLAMAYQQYDIARSQVAALEAGILRQAEAALTVAEAAYRFGERGYIEVLDAQRVYRAARSELTNARYELAAAWVELEKLRAQTGE